MTGRYKVITVSESKDRRFHAEYDSYGHALDAAKRMINVHDTGAAIIDQMHNTMIAYTMRTQHSDVTAEWTFGELHVQGVKAK